MSRPLHRWNLHLFGGFGFWCLRSHTDMFSLSPDMFPILHVSLCFSLSLSVLTCSHLSMFRLVSHYVSNPFNIFPSSTFHSLFESYIDIYIYIYLYAYVGMLSSTLHQRFSFQKPVYLRRQNLTTWPALALWPVRLSGLSLTLLWIPKTAMLSPITCTDQEALFEPKEMKIIYNQNLKKQSQEQTKKYVETCAPGSSKCRFALLLEGPFRAWVFGKQVRCEDDSLLPYMVFHHVFGKFIVVWRLTKLNWRLTCALRGRTLKHPCGSLMFVFADLKAKICTRRIWHHVVQFSETSSLC